VGEGEGIGFRSMGSAWIIHSIRFLVERLVSYCVRRPAPSAAGMEMLPNADRPSSPQVAHSLEAAPLAEFSGLAIFRHYGFRTEPDHLLTRIKKPSFR